ncbi:hypothetical protein AB205_0012020 [Aquarana catesbeiana]|uniref:Uncharacterized protein n=1 Tax=Aquarana catesbeiana TaxID=8400 RepID=A0A2G9RZB3_AQUCT|nr:hypothetical protein AB205_0012020 [Aquarana catesbeiana]
MGETQQVSDNYTNEEEEKESPERETSRSGRRQFKASNLSFGEMLEMVDILKKADYDGKSAQETVVGTQIKRARAAQKDPKSAAKK